MKKLLFFLTLMFSVNLSWAYDFSAVAPSGQTLYYGTISGNEVTVTCPEFGGMWRGYAKPTGNLIIPESVTYGGATYQITSIRAQAFEDCSDLTSVTIPNTVTQIGGYAFSGCSGLASVTIGSSVTNIEFMAFKDCISLTSIVIPNSVTNMGSDVFSRCRSLESVELSTSLTRIPGGAFSGCDHLTSVTIPNSVTSIGQWAFNGCSSLANVTIGNSVTIIEEWAFLGCRSLDSIVIPGSVATIGPAAFSSCQSLSHVTIPNSVTYIGGSAFKGCSALRHVVIPNSVTTIESDAFGGVGSITYCGPATGMPWGANNAGCFYTEGDFIYSNSAKDTLAGYIGSATDVIIPSTVTTIMENAFKGQSTVKCMTLPNSVNNVGSDAYGSVRVVISCGSAPFRPLGTRTAGHYFKEGDFVYEDSTRTYLVGYIGDDSVVNVPNTVIDIHRDVFGGGLGPYFGINCIYLPNSVRNIGLTWSTPYGEISDDALSGINTVVYCGSLNDSTCYPWHAVHFGCFVTDGDFIYTNGSKDTLIGYIGHSENVVIPNTVTSIGKGVFSQRSFIKSVTIPESVTSIGASAFDWCTGITSISIPESVTSIGEWAFVNCDNLNHIIFNATNCTTIGSDSKPAFQNENISIVLTIGDNVQSIPANAFRYCHGLHSVVIPNSVTSIGDYAFAYLGTDQLKNIIIGDSVVTIGGHAFRESCGSNTTVTIGRSLNSIGAYAFYSGYDLDTVFALGETPATLGYTAMPRVRVCAVPCSSVDQYQQAGYPNVVGSLGYDYSITTQDYEKGTIAIDTTPTCAIPTLAFSAMPNYGYHFVQWNDGDTNNPRSLTMTCDTAFVAQFSPNQYSVEVSSANTTMGSVAGSAVLDYLMLDTIVATANYGYHFLHWLDGNAENPRVVVADSNKSYMAQFANNQYTVTGISSNGSKGTVLGSGTFEYLSSATLTVAAYSGYVFTQWSDGSTQNPYTLTVTQDSIIYAQYAPYPSEPEYVHDTTVIHDTTYVDVFVPVHDTTYIDNYIHDTTYVDVFVPVHDTTYIDNFIHDTTYVDVFVPVHDTTIVNNYIYDTTFVDRWQYDTTYVDRWQYDTTYVDVMVPVHDTTIVDNYIYDTTYVDRWQYDTTYVDVIVPVHDTTIVDNYIYDTTYVDRWQYDTTYVDVIVPVHDTTIIDNYIYDTTYVDVLIHDTAFIDVYIYDTVTMTEPLDYYSLTVLSADMEEGLVAGNGSFPEGTMVEIAAVPMVGYRFEGWQDGNTENPRTVTVGHDMTFTASFTASTQSIDVSETASHLIYTRGTQIVVENAENARVRIFDVVGRCISVSDRAEYYTIFNMPTSGAYFVQVGNYPAQKVVVIE